MDGWTYVLIDAVRTYGQPENIMPPAALSVEKGKSWRDHNGTLDPMAILIVKLDCYFQSFIVQHHVGHRSVMVHGVIGRQRQINWRRLNVQMDFGNIFHSQTSGP